MKSLAVIIGAVLAWLNFRNRFSTEPEPEPELENINNQSFVDWNAKPVMSLDELYAHYGKLHNLDPMLLKAIAQVESSENPKAKNPTDPSYGLMQLLCRPDGKGSCANKLNVLDWPPGSVVQLYDPEYSLNIASQILTWNIGRYGFLRGIACYNHWGAHLAEPDGPFPNQGYVDKVMSHYRSLGGVEGPYGVYQEQSGYGF